MPIRLAFPSHSSLPPPPTAALHIRSRSPSTPRISPRLQRFQYLIRVRIRIDNTLRQFLRAISSSNILHNIVRICQPYNRYLGCKPLLEGLGNEVAVAGEPAREGRADVDGLRGGGGGGGEGDIAFVDRDVFLGGGCYADLGCGLI